MKLLGEFVYGLGESRRTYGLDDVETQEMQNSPGVQKMREEFIRRGCANTTFAYGTWEAAWDTILYPGTADWSSTAVQVGGFAGATVVNEGNGTITIRIPNQAGLHSFSYHRAPNRKGGTGPMRTISQEFQWTESLPCGCPSR
jgi:hypothetical protein